MENSINEFIVRKLRIFGHMYTLQVMVRLNVKGYHPGEWYYSGGFSWFYHVHLRYITASQKASQSIKYYGLYLQE